VTGFPRQLSLTAAGLACLLILPAVASASAKAPQKHHPAPPPAVCVYSEMGCAGNAAGGGGGGSFGGGGSSTRSGSTSPGQSTYVPMSTKATRALQSYGGAQRDLLNKIATSTKYGVGKSLPKGTGLVPNLKSTPVGVFGSTIDAGSGMRVLLIVLLGSALLIAAAVVQHRRRRS